MPNNGYFDTVFGVNGDLATVPDALDPGGTVSFDQGYSIGYQIPPGDPGSLPVERNKMNYLFNVITAAIQQYQQHGTPPFITTAMNGGTPFSYSKGDRVIYSGAIYISLDDSNTQTPPDTKWSVASPVAAGGTGRDTLTAYNLLIGNGTGAVSLLAPSAATGIPLVSQGNSANPAYTTVSIAGGGTGQTNAAGAFAALKQDATTSATGVVELATDAEALGGADTTRAVTSAGLASSKSLSGNGYMKLPGGLIIQWGTSGSTGDNTDFPISFPISFPSACASVTVDGISPTAGGFAVVNVRSKSTSGFVCNQGGGDVTNTGTWWIATGY